MGPCNPDFTAVASTLGGIDCAGANAVVTVRDPVALDNWTLPVVEAVMIVGAVAALVHAVLWWRRRGDPTNLALWCACVVYVGVLEPPLYFPDRFGLQEQVGLIFVHNVFSVQFLYDRLPLYIVALYPALTYLAYAIVQRTRVFERRGAVAGAACVAFVFHAFYEIFDHIGPQLRWWAWNPGAPTNTPWLASVPLTSLAIFAGASPFGIALLTRLLIARRAARGPVPAASMALRTIGVGVLTPLAMLVFSLPYGVLGRSDPPDVTGQAVVLWAEVALIGLVALWAFGGAARGQAPPDTPPDSPPDTVADRYAVAGGVVYLLVFAVLWATALPAHLAAEGGRTPSGAPIGSLAYVIGCVVVCVGVLVLAARRSAVGAAAGGRALAAR